MYVRSPGFGQAPPPVTVTQLTPSQIVASYAQAAGTVATGVWVVAPWLVGGLVLLYLVSK